MCVLWDTHTPVSPPLAGVNLESDVADTRRNSVIVTGKKDRSDISIMCAGGGKVTFENIMFLHAD